MRQALHSVSILSLADSYIIYWYHGTEIKFLINYQSIEITNVFLYVKLNLSGFRLQVPFLSISLTQVNDSKMIREALNVNDILERVSGAENLLE